MVSFMKSHTSPYLYSAAQQYSSHFLHKNQHTCFYKIIHFSVQFSAILKRFIVKT